jgi:hypothetical protein
VRTLKISYCSASEMPTVRIDFLTSAKSLHRVATDTQECEFG